MYRFSSCTRFAHYNSDLDRAEQTYLHTLRLDPTSHTALASLAMISHQRSDVRGAVRLYHSALALSPQDPIVTVLLEMALKDAARLSVITIPGLPPALTLDGKEFDPFGVSKGNPAFGGVGEDLQDDEEEDEDGGVGLGLGLGLGMGMGMGLGSGHGDGHGHGHGNGNGSDARTGRGGRGASVGQGDRTGSVNMSVSMDVSMDMED